jgi:hypothetical protein
MHERHDDLPRDWHDNVAAAEDDSFRFLRSLKMVARPERLDAQTRAVHQRVLRTSIVPKHTKSGRVRVSQLASGGRRCGFEGKRNKRNKRSKR